MKVRPEDSCLFFSYYARVPNTPYGGLSLKLQLGRGTIPLWATARRDLDIWQVAEVQIPREREYQVRITLKS